MVDGIDISFDYFLANWDKEEYWKNDSSKVSEAANTSSPISKMDHVDSTTQDAVLILNSSLKNIWNKMEGEKETLPTTEATTKQQIVTKLGEMHLMLENCQSMLQNAQNMLQLFEIKFYEILTEDESNK